MSTRRKPQAPNRQRPASVHMLFIGPQHGALSEIAGAYSTQARAGEAQTRIQFPHRWEIVAVPVDVDMFTKLGDMTVRDADDDGPRAEITEAPAIFDGAGDGPWQVIARNPLRRWALQRRHNRAWRNQRAERINAAGPTW